MTFSRILIATCPATRSHTRGKFQLELTDPLLNILNLTFSQVNPSLAAPTSQSI